MSLDIAGYSLESKNTEVTDEVDGITASCYRKKSGNGLNCNLLLKLLKFYRNLKLLSLEAIIRQSSKNILSSDDGYIVSKSGIYNEFYNMDFKYNGYLLIFAHSKFTVAGAEERPIEEDIAMLLTSFRQLNFNCIVKRNKKLREIQEIIKEISSMDFDKYASFAIAISSHGKDDGILALDAVYDLNEELIEPFKTTESLFGKPKMVFVGCCRGKSVDNGIHLLSSVETDGSMLQEFRIPREADTLIVYASVQGFIAFHNEINGSQFFIHLTEALDDFAAVRDLLTVITLANQRLAISFSSYSKKVELHNKKQCLCIVSTLTRKIMFKLEVPRRGE